MVWLKPTNNIANKHFRRDYNARRWRQYGRGFWTVFTRSAFTRNEHSASVVITCDFEPVKEESALLVIFVEINIVHLTLDIQTIWDIPETGKEPDV